MLALVVSIQGAELSLLTQLAASHLPWWHEALGRGLIWPMNCGPAPYEPSNLTSALTGVGRGRHGCFSYWRIRPDGNAPARVLESTDLRAPRIWHWPNLSDVRFGIINIQLTYPPDKLNGFMLSYLMKQTLRYSYPDAMAHDLALNGIRYGHDVSVFYRGEPQAEFARRVGQVAEYQLRATLALAKSVNVLIVNLSLLDRLSHFLWADLADKNEFNAQYLLDGYRFIDRALQQLDACCNDAPLLVFSEIGFGPLERFVSLDSVLEAGRFQYTNQHGEIDEARSVAREAVQGSHGIVLLSRAEDDRHVAEEVRHCLLEAREEGRTLVKNVWARENLYRGECIDLAPDLVVEPSNLARPPLGDSRWARHVNRTLQNGWHRDTGFLMALRAKQIAPAGTVILPENIAATISAIIGREPVAGLDGSAVACIAS